MNWKKVAEIILAVLTFGLSLLKKKEYEECTDPDCECTCHTGSGDSLEE